MCIRDSTLTVAENKSTAVFNLNLGCAVAGKGLAVQAQIECFAIHRQMAAEGSVLRQVNVGGIVGICDTARAVPCRIGQDVYKRQV